MTAKERRVDPQVVVGLLVDRTGLPLRIGCWEGNRAESTTIIPVVEALQRAHGIEGSPVVADAGMLSATNLKALDEARLRFIVGARATRTPGDLEAHFHWRGDALADGELIDTITPRRGGGSKGRDEGVEAVWDPTEHSTASVEEHLPDVPGECSGDQQAEDGDEARVEDARPSVEASVLGDERLHLRFDGGPTRVPDPRVVHEEPQERVHPGHADE